jgi:hypothetical protein
MSPVLLIIDKNNNYDTMVPNRKSMAADVSSAMCMFTLEWPEKVTPPLSSAGFL